MGQEGSSIELSAGIAVVCLISLSSGLTGVESDIEPEEPGDSLNLVATHLDKSDTSTRVRITPSVTTATDGSKRAGRGSNPRARVPDTAWHARFIDALARTGQVGAAARAAGVTRSTAYEHRSRYAGFREAWSDTLEAVLDDVECALMDRAQAGDVRAGIWLLTRLRPSVYAASAVCPSCRHRAAEDTNGSPVLKVATLAEQEAEITRILRVASR